LPSQIQAAGWAKPIPVADASEYPFTTAVATAPAGWGGDLLGLDNSASVIADHRCCRRLGWSPARLSVVTGYEGIAHLMARVKADSSPAISEGSAVMDCP
jgi:hypothetical protein